MNPVFASVYTVSEWAVVPSQTSALKFINDPNVLECSSFLFSGVSSPTVFIRSDYDNVQLYSCEYGDCDVGGFNYGAPPHWAATTAPPGADTLPALTAQEYTRVYVSSVAIGGAGVWPEVDILLTGNCILRVSNDDGRSYRTSGTVVQDVSKTYNLVPMPDGNGYALNTLPVGLVAVVRLKFLDTKIFTADTSAGSAYSLFSINCGGKIQALIAYKGSGPAKRLATLFSLPLSYPPSLGNTYVAASVVPNAYSIVEWMVLQAPQTVPGAPPAYNSPTYNSSSLFSSSVALLQISSPSQLWTIEQNGEYGQLLYLGPFIATLNNSGYSDMGVDSDFYFDVYLAGIPGCFNLCLLDGESKPIEIEYYPDGGYTALLPISTPSSQKDVSGAYSIVYDNPDAANGSTGLIYPGFGATSIPSDSLVVIRLKIASSYFKVKSPNAAATSNIMILAYGVAWDKLVVENILQGVVSYQNKRPAGFPPSLESMYTVTPPPLTVTPSGPIALTSNTVSYTPKLSGALARTLNWTSQDPEVVAVDKLTGTLTPGPNALGGSTTVTVTALGGASGASGASAAAISPVTFPVTITAAAPLVTNIALSPTSITTVIGAAPVTVIPAITPGGAAGKVPLAWSSNNPSVASVTQAGVVTLVGTGNAIITLLACDGSNSTASVQVSVQVPVKSIVISPLVISASETGVISAPLTASVLPLNASNKNITWTTDSWMVAKVDPSSGAVNIVGNGSTNIIATAADGSGVTGSIPVNVALAVQSIDITPTGPLQATVAGATMQLTAIVHPAMANIATVSWSSTDSSVATVDATTGLVTIVDNGTTNITATATDKMGATASVAIKVAIPPVTIAPDYSTIILQVGKSTIANVITSPPGTKPVQVTWAMNDNTAATVVVSASGTATVSGTAPGVAVLTATAVTAKDNKTGKLLTAVFNVGVQTQPVVTTSVGIVATDGTAVSTLQLQTGSKLQLVAQVLPVTAADNSCTWTSSNQDVVTVVSQNGGSTATLNVLAVGDGKPVTITVTTNDASKCIATTSVVVTPIPTGITLSPSTMALKGVGATGSAPMVSVQPPGATGIAVTWTSSNVQVATVDAKSGVITAVTAGKATITATPTGVGTTLAPAAATVTVPVLATAIKLIPNTPQTVLLTDAAPVFSATLTPTKPDVTTCQWSESSNGAVATINGQGGQVTLVGPGTTTITVATTDGSNLSASTALTVVSRVTGIAFSKSTVTLDTSSQPYTPGVVITPSNASNQNLSWTSSAPEVASVDSILGSVTPVADGSATITSRSTDGGTVTATFGVVVNNSGKPPTKPASGAGTPRKHSSTVKVIIIIVAVLVVLSGLLAAFLVYRKKHRV